jgi:hypothetical protein
MTTPAFPQQFNGTTEPSLSGMTLRDYFAARALQGLLSSIGEWSTGTPDVEFSNSVAIDSYWIADAMMEARKE